MPLKIEFLKKYYSYSSKRFPLPIYLTYTGVLFLAAYSFAGGSSSIQLWPLIAGYLTFFLSLFHLKILDEIKSQPGSAKVLPALTYGLSQTDFKKLLFVCFAIELILSLSVGMAQFVMWFLFFLFSFLASKDFLASEFLRSRAFLSLALRQISVILIVFYIVSLRIGLFNISGEAFFYIFSFSIAIACISASFDLLVKSSPYDQEKTSYFLCFEQWGNLRTLIVGLFSAFTGILILAFFLSRSEAGTLYYLFLSLPLILPAGFVFYFTRKPGLKNYKLIQLTVLVSIFFSLGTASTVFFSFF